MVVDNNLSYAYVTLNSQNDWCGRTTNELKVVDISNIENPNEIAQYEMNGPRGLGLAGDTLFLCDNGLKVYDVSQAKNIKLIHHFQDFHAKDVIPYRNMLFGIGEDGFFQYRYSQDTIIEISNIPVNQ